MPMDPAAFYQLGAQAGAQRMGGLPQQMDQSRQMMMQLAPTLMAAQTNQQELGYKKPYYESISGYHNALVSQGKNNTAATLLNAYQKNVGDFLNNENDRTAVKLKKDLTSKDTGRAQTAQATLQRLFPFDSFMQNYQSLMQMPNLTASGMTAPSTTSSNASGVIDPTSARQMASTF